MALTRQEIQKKSDEKRGLIVRGYKLPAATVTLIKQLAEQRNISQAALITEAVQRLAQSN